jgi:xanthine dehydrogenase accessory factor
MNAVPGARTATPSGQQPVVRVVVAGVQGSAPRAPGASLVYWHDACGRPQIQGSIGGGELEARAMQIAAHLLAQPHSQRRSERFALGAALAQCCGGMVELYWEHYAHAAQLADLHAHAGRPGLLRYCALHDAAQTVWLDAAAAAAQGLPALPESVRAGLLVAGGVRWFVERLDEDATELWLYGAGHVGEALARVLGGLPFRLVWLDSRPEILAAALRQAPDATRVRGGEALEAHVAAAPDTAWHVVMTHSHALDLRICTALLTRNRFGFAGLIGSRTKAARFRHRLAQAGCTAAAVARLQCPIGIASIRDKAPAAIAIAVAAQLLQAREAACLDCSTPLKSERA